MVIALTGLGGSGKSTVTQWIHMTDPSARVLHYPDLLVLTRFLRRLLKRDTAARYDESNFTFQNPVSVLIKALIQWIDAWVVWWRFGRRGTGDGQSSRLIVFDRFAYDQFIYYFSITRRGHRLLSWLVRTLPRVDLLVHLSVPPAVAYERKREWSLEILEREASNRSAVLKYLRMPVYTLDGTASPNTSRQAVVELLTLLQTGPVLDAADLYLAGLLDSELHARYPSLLQVLRPNPADVYNAARRNRLLYSLSVHAPGSGLFPAEVAAGRLAAYRQTLQRLATISVESGIPLLILKDFHRYPVPNLPSDVDISVRGEHAAALFRTISSHGPIRKVEPHKWEWSPRDGVPVDIYVGGVFDGDLLFVTEEALWEGAVQGQSGLWYPRSDIEALLVIEHAIHETGLMLLRDLLQTRMLLDRADRTAVLREAERCGWGPLCRRWLETVDRFYDGSFESNIWRFPVFLPLTSTLAVWIRKIGSDPIGAGGGGRCWRVAVLVVRALRMWRVRKQGRIPFHNFEV